MAGGVNGCRAGWLAVAVPAATSTAVPQAWLHGDARSLLAALPAGIIAATWRPAGGSLIGVQEASSQTRPPRRSRQKSPTTDHSPVPVESSGAGIVKLSAASRRVLSSTVSPLA